MRIYETRSWARWFLLVAPVALPLCSALMLGTTSAHADAAAAPSVTVADDQWTQLVVPGDPAGYEVGELFGPQLGREDYAKSWIVFTFDSATQSYVDPGAGGGIEQGQAFWLIQRTGEAVTLSLPPDLPLASANGSCATEDCVQIPLSTRPGGPGWNMVGTPTREALPTASINIYSDAGASPCAGGCTISEASDNEIVDSKYWRYDGGSASYVDVVESGQVNPWEGAWVGTYPHAVNHGLRLEIAGIETGPSADPLASIEVQVSPFVEDRNAVIISNRDTGAKAKLVGNRDAEGFLEEIEHVRVEGLELDGEATPLGLNMFSFDGDDGSRLVMKLDDQGNLAGYSFRVSADGETISEGDLLVEQRASRAAGVLALPSSSGGRSINVDVTKCGGMPQPDPRPVLADITLDGIVRDQFFTGPEDWIKNGSTYTTSIPDYSRSWEADVEMATTAGIELLGNAVDGACVGVNSYRGGRELLTRFGYLACGTVATSVSAAFTPLVGAIALAGCNTAVTGLYATCAVMSTPGGRHLVNQAFREAAESAELTITVRVHVESSESNTPTDSATETVDVSGGTAPIDFSLHGGPVDTVTRISSSPNPSRPGEPVSVEIEVSEKDGTGCHVDRGAVDLREFPPDSGTPATLIDDGIYGGPMSSVRSYTDQQTGRVTFLGRYSAEENDRDFKSSEQASHAHQVTAGEVIRIERSFVSFDGIGVLGEERDYELESTQLMYGDTSYGKKYEYITTLGWGEWIGEDDDGECRTTTKHYYRENSISGGAISIPASEQAFEEVSQTYTWSVARWCNRFSIRAGSSNDYSWTFRGYSPRWVALAGSSASVADVPNYFCASENTQYDPNYCHNWSNRPPGYYWPSEPP